jgi:hypothetical protein
MRFYQKLRIEFFLDALYNKQNLKKRLSLAITRQAAGRNSNEE